MKASTPAASAPWWSAPMAAIPTSNAGSSRRASRAACRRRVQVVNDAELMVPAAGYFGGISVVAGTGSIAVARTPDGRMLAAGGWGWILGDEGSAPALVREAAKAIRGAIDAGDGADPLTDALMAELGTDDPTMLGRLLNDTRSAVDLGALRQCRLRGRRCGFAPGTSASSSRVVRRWRRWWASSSSAAPMRRASSRAAASSSSSPG